MFLKITRKIYKASRYSYGLTLPKAVLDLFGWRDGSIIEVAPNFKRKEINLRIRKI